MLLIIQAIQGIYLHFPLLIKYYFLILFHFRFHSICSINFPIHSSPNFLQ